jgi:2-methylfumaryl-CoA hydratase
MSRSKTRSGNYFEDFRLGARIAHPTPRTITDGDCALYIALTGARGPVHCAVPVARAMGYRDRTVDDLLLFHVAFGKTVPDISLNAVRISATRTCASSRRAIQATRSARNRSDRRARNSNRRSGSCACDRTRTTSTTSRCSPGRAGDGAQARSGFASPETVVPFLPDSFRPRAHHTAPNPQARASVTGAGPVGRLRARRTDRPSIGHDARGIRPHARHPALPEHGAVHFDELAMKRSSFDRRLVYGGHVISVCRALATTA